MFAQTPNNGIFSRDNRKTPVHPWEFPRVEIVFDCVAVPDAQPAFAGDDSRFIQLTNLKKLLDGGIITQDEFNQEKAKILAQPMRNAPQAAP